MNLDFRYLVARKKDMLIGSLEITGCIHWTRGLDRELSHVVHLHLPALCHGTTTLAQN